MSARVWSVGVVLVGFAACKDGASKRPPPRPDAGDAAKAPVGEVAGDAEGVWIYAAGTRSREAPPARFAAELPAGVEAMKRFRERDPGMPPRVYVEDQVCGLDEEMLARLDAAIAATPEAERAEAVASWSELIASCGDGLDDSRFCSGTRPLVTGPIRGARDVLLLPFARNCSTADDLELFARSDTPPAARVAYARRLAWTGSTAEIDEAKKLCLRGGETAEVCAELGQNAPPRPEKPVAGGSRDDAARLADQLRTIRLLGAEPFPLPENSLRAHTAADLLEHAGRAHGFDAETGSFPNDHDHLARRLARLCRPALDGALFAEEPPPDSESPADYRLDAWVAGEKLSTAAKNLGDWYDVEAVVGLVNAALRVARSDCRLLILPSEGQVAIVAAGPAEALIAAIGAGLFPE